VLVIFWVPLFFVMVTALFKTPRKTERNGEAQ
jgi:multidrug efflux pump